jgi:thiamine-phosphate pyrophosphorylase
VTLPRLHVVTNDDVLAAADFRDRASALLGALGPALALHLRSPGGDVRRLLAEAEALFEPAHGTGALLLVNDRPDVALAAGTGVQLGYRSIPVQAVRGLLGGEAVIGYSAHGAAEAVSAVGGGADFVLIGTIWATPSHPGHEAAGLDRVRETAATVGAPVLAIGGVTPARARLALDAGAWGVAAIRGVWDVADPVVAARRYLEEMGVDSP